MKKHLILAILLTPPVLAQSTVVIHSEDFETGGETLTDGNNHMSLEIVADPGAGAAQGMVGAGDVGGGTARWGSVQAIPSLIQLPAATEAGISSFEASMQVYIPASTTYAGTDRIGIILRWNGVNPGNSQFYFNWDEVTPDTWTTLTVSGTIPVVDSTGVGVTSVVPLLSFDDQDNDAAAGVAAYIDDFELEVGVSLDDPNLSYNTDINYGDVEQENAPSVKIIPLVNSGATQDLSISAIALSDSSSELFSLPEDLTFPIILAPGESLDLQVSFTPGEDLGFFAGKVEFTSNDATTPLVESNLIANVIASLEWPEFVINGDFETGDLTAWRDNNRVDASAEQARSGSTSVVFNLLGGNQWGELRFQHDDQDPTDSIPITPEMIGKEFAYSAWYYRPETGGMAENDTVRTIFRWNAVNTNNTTFGTTTVRNLPVGIWHKVSGRGIIPATGGDGEPTTGVTVLWSFQDVDSDAEGGEIMYLDDVSIKINVPIVVEPVELKITFIEHDSLNNVVNLTYQATPGTTYAIDRSIGLTEAGQPDGWLELTDSELADEGLEAFSDPGAPVAGEKFFYRVRVAE